MSCSVCFEEVVDDAFSAHSGHQHLFHSGCILPWIENSPEAGFKCPTCQKPIDNFEGLIKIAWNSKKASKLILNSDNSDLVANVLTAFDFSLADKVEALCKYAVTGNMTTFEVMFFGIKHNEIDCKWMDKIVDSALVNKRLDYVKELFKRGYVQVFDICRSLEGAVVDGMTEAVKFFCDNGVTCMAGPREDNPYMCPPMMLLIRAVGYNRLEVLELLLQNGYADYFYTFKDQSSGLLFPAINLEDRACFNILLRYGMDVCKVGCHAFLACTHLDNIKWLIEIWKCPHRETWKAIHRFALSDGKKDIYFYMSEKLGKKLKKSLELQLRAALESHDEDVLKNLLDSGRKNQLEIRKYFPELSSLVKNLGIYSLLTDYKCNVTPNVHLFIHAFDEEDAKIVIDDLVAAGLKIDEALFDDCSTFYQRLIWELPDAFEIFYNHGVDKTLDEEGWAKAIWSSNLSTIKFLIRTVDQEWLFSKKNIITLLSENEYLNEYRSIKLL